MNALVFLLLCLLIVPTTVHSVVSDEHEQWFIDSYHYGEQGNNCSDIYYNYGINNWTFNSEDPTLLKDFYEACKAGEDDRAYGRNSLIQLLDNFRHKRE